MSPNTFNSPPIGLDSFNLSLITSIDDKVPPLPCVAPIPSNFNHVRQMQRVPPINFSFLIVVIAGTRLTINDCAASIIFLQLPLVILLKLSINNDKYLLTEANMINMF